MGHSPERILLLDCNYLCHRARWAMKSLATADTSTGIMYGFLMAVLSLSKRFQTRRFVFCWDSKHSVRKKEYPGYKSHRGEGMTEEEREDLHKAFVQFSLLRRKILPSIGFRNVFLQKGMEADDLLAIISAEPGDSQKIIVSADEDLYQLISPTVSFFSPAKEMLLTNKGFRRIYGIRPKRWAEVKAIAGCGTDEVVGVKGVGEKKAIAYLLGTLPDGKVKDLIQASRALIKKNRPIVTLPHRLTLPIRLREDRLDRTAFASMAGKYEMYTFLKGGRAGGLSEGWAHFFRGQRRKGEGL